MPPLQKHPPAHAPKYHPPMPDPPPILGQAGQNCTEAAAGGGGGGEEPTTQPTHRSRRVKLPPPNGSPRLQRRGTTRRHGSANGTGRGRHSRAPARGKRSHRRRQQREKREATCCVAYSGDSSGPGGREHTQRPLMEQCRSGAGGGVETPQIASRAGRPIPEKNIFSLERSGGGAGPGRVSGPCSREIIFAY